MAAQEKRVVRERVSPDEWRERIVRWKSSGLSGKDFAVKEGLSARSLSWWSWRLRHPAGPASSATKAVRRSRRSPRKKASSRAVSFLPVVLSEPKSEVPEIVEVVFPSNLRLRVSLAIDESTLLRIVRALGAA